MRYFNQGSGFRVECSQADVEAFKAQWPCSGLPDRAIWFEYDSRGNLVDISPGSDRFDGPALLALSHDAQAYGQKQRIASERGK